jgi:hypothetical protein
MEMTEGCKTEVAGLWMCLVDDAYRAWLAAEHECEQILRTWFKASDAKNATAYLVYCAALDREEVCARELQRLWELPNADRDDLVRQAQIIGRR